MTPISTTPPPPPAIITVAAPVNPTPAALRDALAHAAFAFFWNESDPATGLTKDRARNLASAGADTYTVASIASTGYALAALPIAVERGWVTKTAARERALVTLRFFRDKEAQEHGFYYHFIEQKTGARAWNSELSSIDTGLFLLGALTAGQYFGGETKQIADALYARTDFRWMRDGTAPAPAGTPAEPAAKPLTLSMGWNPEQGFLENRWAGYEDTYLYLLALGAPHYNLGGESWRARTNIKPRTFEGFAVLQPPSPIFWAQMTSGYFDLRGKHDAQGYDYSLDFVNTHKAHVAFCARHPDLYPNEIFGVNASDGPSGYGGEDPLDGKTTGTITPTGAVAAFAFVPAASETAMMHLWTNYHDKAWGRYGFSNAINVPKNYYDPDVIGIDLGMMLLCLEDARSGLVWKLIGSHPMTGRALRAAGFARNR